MNIKSMFNGLLKTVVTYGKNNAPTLLTAGGIALGGATVVLVAKESPKAKEKKEAALAKAKAENMNKVATAVEVAKATVPVYAPAIVTGGASVACLIASNKVSNDRLAATVAACGYLQDKITAMQETEKEVLGEAKAEDLKRKTYEHMAEKAVEKGADPDHPEEPKKPYAGMPQLYYDVLNGRFLRSTDDILREAENKVNMVVYGEYLDGSFDDFTGPNEFYDFVGWDRTTGAEGWKFPSSECFKYGGDGIGLKIGKTIIVAPNGEAAKAVEFENIKPKWASS